MQSVAENCRFSPQQLLRGRGATFRGAVRLSPSALDSRHAVRRASTVRTRTLGIYIYIYLYIYMCMSFIDLQKAYDSVDRELLWVVFSRFSVSERC